MEINKNDGHISVEIVMQSHLSDAMIEITTNPSLAKNRILFVKHLIMLRSQNKIGPYISDEQLDELWDRDKK